MKKLKKITILLLVFMLVITSCLISANAANLNDNQGVQTGAGEKIIVHYKSTSVEPYIYYWNTLPVNIETPYPGVKMTKNSSQGAGWYSFTFPDKTKANILFTDSSGKQLSKELTRNTGEWWYHNNRWYSKNPDTITDERTDFREESIYFVITTRFYDGDTGNNVHCWDDKKANNPDSDPAWRGDFKGLIDKLDYIKALGFSAIWITPVVENASGYDYHGYHAMDFNKVDVRNESSGVTFQDVIDAAHAKDMKIVQDVVINHSGNFGEAFLAPMFKKVYTNVKDLANISSMQMISDSKLAKSFPNYSSLDDGAQFQARLAIMKNTDGKNHDTDNYYHHYKDLSWESPTVQTGQIAGDCVDINTENYAVAQYLNGVYEDYINMGVDAFRMDTEKHVSRLTLNEFYFPAWRAAGGENFFVFGEVCTRVSEFWNHNIPAISAPFYTWAETTSNQLSKNPNDWESNVNKTLAHYEKNASTNSQPTSKNVYLNGNDYHTPDYSKSNRTGVIDFPMHWNFSNASEAYRRGLEEDPYVNDSTWSVTYVDSHDYGPNMDNRYNGGTTSWAENLCLLFTFRGIPCVYYGSEVEFKAGVPMDVGPNAPLSTTGRAYFGDYLEGTVNATDFGTFTASGKVADTLNSPLSKHITKLNQIRRAVPALQKGQYSTSGVSGNMAFKRRYTNKTEGVDSFVCVSITDGATFSGIPNGTYIDAVTGDTKQVSNGSLSIPSSGKGNMRVYVLSSNGFTGISGKIGTSGSFLK